MKVEYANLDRWRPPDEEESSARDGQRERDYRAQPDAHDRRERPPHAPRYPEEDRERYAGRERSHGHDDRSRRDMREPRHEREHDRDHARDQERGQERERERRPPDVGWPEPRGHADPRGHVDRGHVERSQEGRGHDDRQHEERPHEGRGHDERGRDGRGPNGRDGREGREEDHMDDHVEGHGHADAELEEMRAELREAEWRLSALREEVHDLEDAEAAALEGGGGGAPRAYSDAGASRARAPLAGPLGIFSMVLIAGSGPGDARKKAAKMRERITSPCDFNVKLPAKPKEVRKRFAEAARTQSEHGPSRAKGGDLGSVASGDLEEALEEAARSLAIGEVSGLIETEHAVHLLLRTG